jgi:hypothetical protein
MATEEYDYDDDDYDDDDDDDDYDDFGRGFKVRQEVTIPLARLEAQQHSSNTRNSTTCTIEMKMKTGRGKHRQLNVSQRTLNSACRGCMTSAICAHLKREVKY